MRISILILAIFCTIVFVLGVYKIVVIYEDIYPYKQEMRIYYQYKVVDNDTLFIDSVVYTLE